MYNLITWSAWFATLNETRFLVKENKIWSNELKYLVDLTKSYPNQKFVNVDKFSKFSLNFY